MDIEYKVVFDYEGFEGILLCRESMQMVMRLLYVAAYNEFCELVNPMYETWNDIYHKEHDSMDHYEEWIASKSQELIDKHINTEDRSLTYYVNPENGCQFIGVDKKHPERKVWFHLEPIK